ncbi:hypothetical protein HK100_002160 [Physocladia obscura]|uniref:Uncharacterized protein n=1 Tax=Physocladia obscura TaxID=109957 RepID=A0AAD5SVS0_9FUNG|nr:hypothetical protein HK100_002160 [Physocladia obscura]
MRTVLDPTEEITDTLMYHKSFRGGGGSSNGPEITRENAKSLVFPRVARARRRVCAIEDQVQLQMASKFEGLTDSQRRAVLQLVSRNNHLLEINKEALNDKKHHRSEALNFNDFLNQLVYNEDEAGVDGTIEDFTICKHMLKSDNGAADKTDDGTGVEKVSEKNSEKISFPNIDPEIGQRNQFLDGAIDQTQQQQQLQQHSPNVGIALLDSGLHNGQQNSSQQETYGDFEILLNACKPAAAESKLAVRLNVMQEPNPSAYLIQALKQNLGVDIKATNQKGIDFLAIKLHAKKRLQVGYYSRCYGNWYIKPTMWNEYMLKKGAEKNPKPREKIGGLVQKKLDQIMQIRAKEDAKMQQALNLTPQSSNPAKQNDEQPAPISRQSNRNSRQYSCNIPTNASSSDLHAPSALDLKILQSPNLSSTRDSTFILPEIKRLL